MDASGGAGGWHGLPPDLLAAVAARLPPAAGAALLGTCHAWRKAMRSHGLVTLQPLWLAQSAQSNPGVRRLRCPQRRAKGHGLVSVLTPLAPAADAEGALAATLAALPRLQDLDLAGQELQAGALAQLPSLAPQLTRLRCRADAWQAPRGACHGEEEGAGPVARAPSSSEGGRGGPGARRCSASSMHGGAEAEEAVPGMAVLAELAHLQDLCLEGPAGPLGGEGGSSSTSVDPVDRAGIGEAGGRAELWLPLWLPRLQGLTALRLGGCPLSDAGDLAALAGHGSLRSLAITWAGPVGHLVALQALPRLAYLSIHTPAGGAAACAKPAPLPAQAAAAAGCGGGGGGGGLLPANLTGLALRVCGSVRLALAAGQLPGLTSLEVHAAAGGGVTEEALVHVVRRLPRLASLTATGLAAAGPRLQLGAPGAPAQAHGGAAAVGAGQALARGDHLIAQLAGSCPDLRVLHLPDTPLLGTALLQAARRPGSVGGGRAGLAAVAHLELDGRRLLRGAVASLGAATPRLQSLVLHAVPPHEFEACSRLCVYQQLPACLRELRLSAGPAAGDGAGAGPAAPAEGLGLPPHGPRQPASLRFLCRLPLLEHLELGSLAFWPASLQPLQALPRLRALALAGMPDPAPGQLAALAALRLPRLEALRVACAPRGGGRLLPARDAWRGLRDLGDDGGRALQGAVRAAWRWMVEVEGAAPAGLGDELLAAATAAAPQLTCLDLAFGPEAASPAGLAAAAAALPCLECVRLAVQAPLPRYAQPGAAAAAWRRAVAGSAVRHVVVATLPHAAQRTVRAPRRARPPPPDPTSTPELVDGCLVTVA